MPQLHVNGRMHAVDCEPDTPLLYALRNDLGLTGARFGCGLGQCGACHVLIGGRSVASCDITVQACEGQSIETIEGLTGAGQALHPLQQAFVDEQAGQCGYCLGGMLSSAMALLRENTQPTTAQIKTALDRHLCRCGTHQRIVQAVHRAAAVLRGESA
jgi:nicotinate dehydrogenase subunit A